MQKKTAEQRLEAARHHALGHGSDLVHALGCLECGLRTEALECLRAMGWDEHEFLGAYFEWLLGVRLDG